MKVKKKSRSNLKIKMEIWEPEVGKDGGGDFLFSNFMQDQIIKPINVIFLSDNVIIKYQQ